MGERRGSPSSQPPLPPVVSCPFWSCADGVPGPGDGRATAAAGGQSAGWVGRQSDDETELLFLAWFHEDYS